MKLPMQCRAQLLFKFRSRHTFTNSHSRILNFHDIFNQSDDCFQYQRKMDMVKKIHENSWLGIRESMRWTAYCLHTWIGTCLVWPSRNQGGYGRSHESYIWNSLRRSQFVRKEQFEGVRVSVAINLSNYLKKKKIETWLNACYLLTYL